MANASKKTDKLRKQAETLFNNQQLTGAKTAYQKLCKLHPTDAQSWHMLSAINGMLGHQEEAEQCCRKVLNLQPQAHGAHLNLANILMAKNQFGQARLHFEKALSLNPNDPQTLTNLGNLCLKEGLFSAAIEHFKRALRADPNLAEAHNNLGTAFRETGEKNQAESCFQRAIQLRPNYTDAYTNLANLYVDDFQFDTAEHLYQQALQYSPNSAATYCNLGKLKQTRGMYDEADKIFCHALKLAPADPEISMAKADLLEKQGDYEGALTLLQPLIKQQSIYPKAALTYAKLSQHHSEYGQAIDALEKLLTSNLTPNIRIDTHFGLGELYDRVGEYDLAFSHFDAGNKLEPHKFDKQANDVRFDAFMRAFSAETMQHLPQSEELSELPVYIVGMPRSGTSLVEQILASHPLVTGGGELGGIHELTNNLPAMTGNASGYPACASRLSQTILNTQAQEYNNNLISLANGSHRFTDKDPLQFFDIGFIRLLLPNSHIIHCSRNPLDTCLSIYFNRFNQFHAYACDLESLGHFYKSYEKLMHHWRTILEEPVYEIRYEEMVTEQESVSRSLIDFCGLEWDDSCLRFYETKRVVNTPSYNQVRKPIYKASVSRWKYYEKHLDPLVSKL